MVLSDAQALGMGLIFGGVSFIGLGVALMFDKGLLALGNIQLLIGILVLIGPHRIVPFFFCRKRVAPTSLFCCGLVLTLWGWGLTGLTMEAIGIINLFGDFSHLILTALAYLPVVGRLFDAMQRNGIKLHHLMGAFVVVGLAMRAPAAIETWTAVDVVQPQQQQPVEVALPEEVVKRHVIAVVGASSLAGSATVHALLSPAASEHRPVDLRLLVADTSSPRAQRLQKRGAMLVAGEPSDEVAIGRLLAGAESLVVLEECAPLRTLLADSSVKTVITAGVDVEAPGVRVVQVQPPLYFEDLFTSAREPGVVQQLDDERIRFSSPLPSSRRVPMVSARDVGRAVAELLTKPDLAAGCPPQLHLIGAVAAPDDVVAEFARRSRFTHCPSEDDSCFYEALNPDELSPAARVRYASLASRQVRAAWQDGPSCALGDARPRSLSDWMGDEGASSIVNAMKRKQ